MHLDDMLNRIDRFNPTLVRLAQEYERRLSEAQRGFNPTLVRLAQNQALVAHPRFSGFNPTLVRLAH